VATLRKERFITDRKGRRRAVILDIKLYQEMLEDLEDLRLLAERQDEATSSLEEVEERLKARGLL
jgi:PHD/YefM family antitoxin component YafN of YafNO toxin-antitoxin module